MTFAVIGEGQVRIGDATGAEAVGEIRRDASGRQIITVSDHTKFSVDIPLVDFQQLAANASSAVNLLRAVTTPVPDDVKAQGPAAADYFKRLVANGFGAEDAAKLLDRPDVQQLIQQETTWRDAVAAYARAGTGVPAIVRLAIADGLQLDFSSDVPEVVSSTGCDTASAGCRWQLMNGGFGYGSELNDPDKLRAAATVKVDEAQQKIAELGPRIGELFQLGLTRNLTNDETAELLTKKTALQAAVNIYELCAGDASGTRLPAQTLVLNTGLGDTETYAGTAFLKQLGAGAQEFQRNANRGDGIEDASGLLVDATFLANPALKAAFAGAKWVVREGSAYLIDTGGRLLATSADVSGPALRQIAEETAEKFLLTLDSPALTYNRLAGTYESRAGLEFGPDGRFGNRIMHVLDHMQPNPEKAVHSVFSVSRSDIIPLLDEAWTIVNATGQRPLANDVGAFVVDMGRPIGTAGETSIRLVVRPGTSRIITAYPVQ